MQKAGSKKTGSLLFKKKKKQPGLFSFWITMTLVFVPCFCNPYFQPNFFLVSLTDPCFKNKNSGCRLTGRLFSGASSKFSNFCSFTTDCFLADFWIKKILFCTYWQIHNVWCDKNQTTSTWRRRQNKNAFCEPNGGLPYLLKL